MSTDKQDQGQNSNRNLFIVIDGVDGVGKTSVARYLAEHYQWTYYKPVNGVFTELRKKINHRECPVASFSFYMLVLLRTTREIKKLLESTTVVCDRYTASSIAYALVQDEEIRKLFSDGDFYEEWNILKPDYNFLLQLDTTERDNRLRRRYPPGVVVRGQCLEWWFDSRKLNQIEAKMLYLQRELDLICININSLSIENVAEQIVSRSPIK